MWGGCNGRQAIRAHGCKEWTCLRFGAQGNKLESGLVSLPWVIWAHGEKKRKKRNPGLPCKGSEQVAVCGWELGVAVLSGHGGRRENVVCLQEQAQWGRSNGIHTAWFFHLKHNSHPTIPLPLLSSHQSRINSTFGQGTRVTCGYQCWRQ